MRKILLTSLVALFLMVACSKSTEPTSDQGTVVTPEDTRVQQPAISSLPESSEDETARWTTYANTTDCYSIKYNSSYRVQGGHNLVNYEGDESRDGIKIQIQKLNLDGRTFADVMDDYPTNQAQGLGSIEYTGKVLDGPGGAFDVFYSSAQDRKNYYAILVWNIENDKQNVHSIVSTFMPLPCE